ncbi:MAG: hypothetical protein NTZ17_18295 [Phycisphaerae bacterium]|nr:hypothetical protein [Phycisphaerae bacterium]
MMARKHSQILWTITALMAACAIGLPVWANDSGTQGSKPTTQISRYVFLSDQSKLVQTGGIAGLHRTYTIEGHFLLTVDPNAGAASFRQVDANAVDDSPFRHSLDPNQVFNLTGLDGAILDGVSVRFEGKAKDQSNIVIQLTFQDGRVTLNGQTIPPPGSADFFVFTLDAVAQRKYSGGSGTAQDPYQIATAADLILLGETPGDYDKYFILTADIDLDPSLPGRKVFDRAVIGRVIPLSGEWQPFYGVFDGAGRKISHVTIRGREYVGLFGILERGAEVKNLGVVDVNIVASEGSAGGLGGWNYGHLTNCYSTGAVSGTGWFVGGLVGYNRAGALTDCYSRAAVSGTRNVGGLVGGNGSHYGFGGPVTRCYSTGAVTGTLWCVGGLIGINVNDVTRCHSASVVTGASAVGGLVGQNCGNVRIGCFSGRLAECYSTGQVSGDDGVGGLVGANGGDMTHCYSTGRVSGRGDNVGGLMGSTSVWLPTSSGGAQLDGTAMNCFWDTQTSCQTTSAGGIGKTTAQMQTAKTFLDAGWDFVAETKNGTADIWWILEGKDYPHLWWEAAKK